jgi:hypothetical protein
MPSMQKLSWDPPRIEWSIEAIRDQIRESLEYWGIPVDVQASALDRYREANSDMSGGKPNPAPRPESVHSPDFTVWSHPYIQWRSQIIGGNLPPEWEEAGVKPPSPGRRKDLCKILILSAKLDHLVNRVEKQLSEANLHGQGPGSGGLEQILKEALHLFLFVNFDDMVCGERQRATNARNARPPHKINGMWFFYCIMKREGVETLPEILYHVGTKRYQRLQLEDRVFIFKNRRAQKVVESYEVKNGRDKLLWSRGYQHSTFYEWRAEASAKLQAEAEEEAWIREEQARYE